MSEQLPLLDVCKKCGGTGKVKRGMHGLEVACDCVAGQAESVRGRDEGIALAEDNAGKEWRELAFKIGVHLAHTQEEIVSDDFWRVMPKPPQANPSALGGIMRKLALAGYVEKTGRVRTSESLSNHRRDLTVWRSLVYRP